MEIDLEDWNFMGWGTLKCRHHLWRIWCYQTSICLSMYEFSAEDRQRTFLKSPVLCRQIRIDSDKHSKCSLVWPCSTCMFFWREWNILTKENNTGKKKNLCQTCSQKQPICLDELAQVDFNFWSAGSRVPGKDRRGRAAQGRHLTWKTSALMAGGVLNYSYNSIALSKLKHTCH